MSNEESHDFSRKIAQELNLGISQVKSTLNLLESGATIPFIARYRKEATGSLDEEVIGQIRDRLGRLRELEKRRETILHSIEEQGKLTDELKKQINEAATVTELEDIYLPYKPKKKTRASVAKEQGLEPLADILQEQRFTDIYSEASTFINEDKGVFSEEDALSGARDIIAERVSENRYIRSRMRQLFLRESAVIAKVVKGRETEAQKYKDYFDWQEKFSKAPSHRVLAMFRGEKEGFLKLKIEVPAEDALKILTDKFIRAANDAAQQVHDALTDGYKRLLKPSMENEVRQVIKENADRHAIDIFAGNFRQLLMGPPLGQKNVLAIDPGFRTGCKVVCLDSQGKLLHNETIYPHPPQNETGKAIQKIKQLVNAYKIEAIAIGNGTAGRETEEFLRKVRFEKDVIAVMVNESGASVYSASAVAREEFPNYDVTVRGAVSIGRRLMDPLAELVKIDPRSIGVGQYQHDVGQPELAQSLKDTVESCVNSVGVELNTASRELLSYVSGLGPALAGNIVEYRNKNGAFRSRSELKKVTRFGEKAFEQAAGFLRVRNSSNPLDKSAVHPESYPVVEKMASSLDCSVDDLIQKEDLRKKIRLADFVSGVTGMPTLKDIMEELARPGRDPREKFGLLEFDSNIRTIEDLKPGMVLPGIVTNITAFGAFVDIGIHENGLIHLSQMADEFVKDPNNYVRLQQKLKVKVLDIDLERKRIQLSLKNVD
ncbi:MAG: RNA-binding transcriptional accessory protein [Bacteroidales bacterium]|nr:RNA-binding transcriptional accessory protein [Bacteroidales bacterium]